VENKNKSKFPLSLKVAIPILAIMLMSVFVLANNAGGPMVTLSFPTTNAANESIYSITIAIYNSGTATATNVTLIPANFATGITVPTSCLLIGIQEKSNQSNARFGPTFGPDTDSWCNFTVVAPNATVYSYNVLLYTAIPYMANDTIYGGGMSGPNVYVDSCDYYLTTSQVFNLNIPLSTGTWVIYLTTYTQ
jgi:hypothetical protein